MGRQYSKSELRQIGDDCEWWTRVGDIFGATLIGFTCRYCATFSQPLGECSGSVARKILEMNDELKALRKA